MAPSAEILASARPDPEFEELAKALGPPPLPADVDIPTLRRVTNERKAKAREAFGGPPPGLMERDIEIPVRDGSKILAYVYAPSDKGETTQPILVFFHGGGFCIGSRHDDMDSNRSIALKAGIVVVSIEYRLAPEHPFPQAVHDGLDAVHWIAKNASMIHPFASPSAGLIIGGTSAGGNIANAVVYLNRDQEVPASVTGQWLSVAPLIPLPFVPDEYKDDCVSHVQNEAVTIPPPKLSHMFLDSYRPDLTSPLLVPFSHPSGHRNIPPTYLQVCGLDSLRDEGIIYERVLRDENDIATRLDLYPGLPHQLWEFFPQLKKHVEKRTADTVNGVLWLLEQGQK